MYAKSKIDWWMHFVFLSLNASILIGVIVGWDVEEAWILLPLFVVLGLVNWIYFATDYRLTASEIIIRSGPFCERIAYRDIASIRLTKNWLSSMALSVDRIEIRQKNKNYILGTTLISPQNREQFYQALQKEIMKSQQK